MSPVVGVGARGLAEGWAGDGDGDSYGGPSLQIHLLPPFFFLFYLPTRQTFYLDLIYELKCEFLVPWDSKPSGICISKHRVINQGIESTEGQWC